MDISSLVSLYLLSHPCCTQYSQSLKRTGSKLVSGGILLVTDFASDPLNQILINLSRASASSTVSNFRREAMTLWKFAKDSGLCKSHPAGVSTVRVLTPPPEAWSLEDLARMLDCAEKDETWIGGVFDRRVMSYMPGWIAISYDTGLRFADVLALRSNNIRKKCIATVAHKTGKTCVRPIGEYSQSQAKRLVADSPDGSLFAWFLTRRRAFTSMQAFLERHGFRGSGKFLRRSCATYIESVRPGEASAYLQHSHASLVVKHYCDQSLLSLPEGPPSIKRNADN